jgi:hypothetical protein
MRFHLKCVLTFASPCIAYTCLGITISCFKLPVHLSQHSHSILIRVYKTHVVRKDSLSALRAVLYTYKQRQRVKLWPESLNTT